jgi:FkbM family methyltransferase
MKIFYGISHQSSIDVTDICFSKLTKNNVITIPWGDYNRAYYFTDPFCGILKKIIISHNENITEYDSHAKIKINITDLTISVFLKQDDGSTINKLNHIHSKLTIKYGTLNEEFEEQKMAVKYLTGSEKVLEIGGNIGRNSLVISSILQDSSNLVTLECDVNIANQLIENRDLNNYHFHVEKSALSNRVLIQNGWITIPSDTLLPGYNFVNTTRFNDLQTKYNIEFDTLVLDCEGAFYYILMDTPEILNNIKLIIMENDYTDAKHKKYVDYVLTQNNFYIDYRMSGGWGLYSNNFFEVWEKRV